MNQLLKLLLILLCIGTMHFEMPIHAQDEASADDGTTEQKSLGNIMAETIQDLLKQGNVFVPNGQSAQPSSTNGDEKFKLNFNNAPIDQVLKFISDLTKKVVLKDDQVNGQFMIVNPEEVSKEEALEIIDQAFMLKGFTFIETDTVLIVLPASTAKQKGVDVQSGITDSIYGSRVKHQIIPVQHALPSDLKTALQPLLSESANIIADDRSRSLIITDTAANVARLQAIINQLDQKGIMDGVSIKVFRLKYLNASDISRDLDDLLENIVGSTLSGQNANERRNQALVEVLADRTTNSLIVSAPGDALDEVEAFIQKLDIPSSTNIQRKTFQLSNGDAAEIAQSLSELSRSIQTNIYRPVIVSDSRSNTVIVSAYEEDVQAFGDLIKTLDQSKSQDKVTEVFPLVNADAIVLREMIEQLVQTQDTNNNNYYYWRYGQGGSGDVTIIEDQRLNALVVTTKSSMMPMVRDLVKQLDVPLPDSKEEPRIYRIQYARASDLSAIFNEVFGEDQNTFGGAFFFGIGESTSLTGLTGKVKFIADPITNSLIVVAATPRAFGVVEKMLEQLDRTSEKSGTRVFKLKNSDAEYLGTQLTELFQRDQSRQGGGNNFFWFGNQSSSQNEPISHMIGNVRIVSETRTNSLMVTTSSQYFPQIEKLIDDLDQDIAQILVEVLIVEIVDIDDNQLGINWPDNIPVNVEANFEAPVSGINLDRASIIGGSQFSAVLDFLSSSDKTKVVARPNIFTRDNQEAFVEVVNEVPVLGNISQNNISSQQGIDYKDVGLKLIVKPHINDENKVTIEVNLETGQVLDAFALTVDGSSLPAFSRRTVNTILTVNHEETAVLSGVIDTSFQDTENGVPGLRHIPVLGHLFKSKGKRRANTELLTFITPYMVDGYEDRMKILQKQHERLGQFQEMLKDIPNLQINTGTK
jgi:type II secretory pathway component GspD/PulD (secretin)